MIHLAIQYDNKELFDHLCLLKGQINLKNKHGLVPYVYAYRQNKI